MFNHLGHGVIRHCVPLIVWRSSTYSFPAVRNSSIFFRRFLLTVDPSSKSCSPTIAQRVKHGHTDKTIESQDRQNSRVGFTHLPKTTTRSSTSAPFWDRLRSKGI